MTDKILFELFILAKREMEKHASLQNFTSVVSPQDVAMPLLRLAAHLDWSIDGTPRILDAEEGLKVLRVFFNNKSIQVLLDDMPNLYWFWAIVREAVRLHDTSRKDNPPEAKIRMRESFANLRRGLLSDTFLPQLIDLNKDIDELTVTEAVYWQANGIILIEIHGNSIKAVRNPIFHKDTMFPFLDMLRL